ncbi:MAG: hypothetical protein KME49_12825 [Brasilonema octagenarum HA4186-MV1]|jgi:hypothetical protein|uniref:DUF5895 domain-containing protein n=2 Tax=Brasilonema TaxID=383614 RepID=A0A856MI64_9CYAN|nr:MULTISPECIES: DUF5895 domain-containing protein [Brasilonema]MBW4626350.1 hypothetical protein [Brasilonema octagenarum HA4186-MV1]NMF65655.1 hypothetical protein [Brasilonema octagenarum UFV-OR1]QDL08827.1 hypothetical protein DP114_13835 [Brasilonema sennae CENA114]QDL15184.1 hypothetical protein DP113_13775 [Brasilonema octagenarum UFV-E1]
MKLSVKFDFEDEKYNAPASQVIPWCQMINPRYGTNGLQPHGLAIKPDNATLVGFQPDDNWHELEHEFSSGVETVYITTTPRIVVVRRGPLSVKDRETGVKLGTLKDNYDAFLADKLKFKTFTRYLIYLVGEDKKFLHESPLQLTLNGAAGASFSKAYSDYQQGKVTSGFVAELERAYAGYRKQPLTPKGGLFHAHGIFCPIINCEERGIEPNTVLVASTVDYKHPTVASLTDYLIASDSQESEIISKTFEEYKDFGKETMKAETPRMEMAGVSSSYVYPDEDDYAYPPY